MGPTRVGRSEASFLEYLYLWVRLSLAEGCPKHFQLSLHTGWAVPICLKAVLPQRDMGSGVGVKMCVKMVKGSEELSHICQVWDTASQCHRSQQITQLERIHSPSFLWPPCMMVWGAGVSYWPSAVSDNTHGLLAPLVVTLAHQKPSLMLPGHVYFPQFCCRFLCPQTLLEIFTVITGCL